MKKIGRGNYGEVWLLKKKDLKKRIRNEINKKKKKTNHQKKKRY